MKILFHFPPPVFHGKVELLWDSPQCFTRNVLQSPRKIGSCHITVCSIEIAGEEVSIADVCLEPANNMYFHFG